MQLKRSHALIYMRTFGKENNILVTIKNYYSSKEKKVLLLVFINHFVLYKEKAKGNQPWILCHKGPYK